MEAILAVALFGSASLFDGDLGPVQEFSVGDQIFFSQDPLDPVGKLFQTARDNRLAKRAGVADASWDQPLTPAAKKTAPSAGNLAKQLGIVRSELRDISGEQWKLGYSANNELVDMRLVRSWD